MISGRRPNVVRSMTSRPKRRLKLGCHSTSSLQLPHAIERASSIRQLHSIIKPISPMGLPELPSRRVVGVSAPSSINNAEPCPRQTCETGMPQAASRKCSIQSVMRSIMTEPARSANPPNLDVRRVPSVGVPPPVPASPWHPRAGHAPGSGSSGRPACGLAVSRSTCLSEACVIPRCRVAAPRESSGDRPICPNLRNREKRTRRAVPAGDRRPQVRTTTRVPISTRP
ncbi:hypothetical protein MBLL_01164 (plasmid) [Methylobacterium bullatum]|uniref:Uncharacterized protein n=1 Tax=Methylobacterium bullatum TaxID=570505 RepID=A0A679JLR3_9HYPH|nr:hypothetical protein MBLL_01164 [Methylobacterium bullatum]